MASNEEPNKQSIEQHGDAFGGDAFPGGSFGEYDPFDPFNSFDIRTAPNDVQAMLNFEDEADEEAWVPGKPKKPPKTKCEPLAEITEEADITYITVEDVEDGDEKPKIAYVSAAHTDVDYMRLRGEKDGLQSENSRLALENAILMQHCMVAAQSAAAASQWAVEATAQSYALGAGTWPPNADVIGAGSWPPGTFPGVWHQAPPAVKGRQGKKQATPKAKAAPAPKAKKAPAQAPPAAPVDGSQTTAVLRNTPTTYTRTKLLELLDANGFANQYDFVYVPFDFKFQKSVGFAFVNLTKPDHAEKFMKHFEAFTDWGVPGEWKAATVNWASPHQGLAAHVQHFKNSPVMHESVPDEQRPAVYQDGNRMDFPPPTENIRPPRMRPGHVTGRRNQLSTETQQAA